MVKMQGRTMSQDCCTIWIYSWCEQSACLPRLIIVLKLAMLYSCLSTPQPAACAGLGPYMQQGMRMGNFSQNTSILDLAAALAENTAIQQEIILNSHRRFHLEVRRPCLSILITLYHQDRC